MILKDAVTNLLLKMDVFMNKKGQDMIVRRELIQTINMITGEESLDTIYINNIDNFNIPDVMVIPEYNEEFNIFVMDGDVRNSCPFGYTIEIHNRCFTKYTAEELTAIVIHDILQNVESCTAKTRFLSAYNDAVSEFKNTDVLDMFDNISNSEVMYMGYVDICMRPFRVPTNDYDYVGTDTILKSMKLSDAYDSALVKSLPMSNDTPEDVMRRELDRDNTTLMTIFKSCMDDDIRHYYTVIKNGIPSVTLQNVLTDANNKAALGFVSKKRNFKRRPGFEPAKVSQKTEVITETYLNPKNEIELRFQIDKIITEIRYCETETERQAILYRIKNLTIKLQKTKIAMMKKVDSHPDNANVKQKLEYINNFLDELEMARQKIVNMEIKEKRYGVFVKCPVGYEY